MKSDDISLQTTSKLFEYEKLSREIEECDDMATLKEMLRVQVKLYMKLQETVKATMLMK